MMLRILEVYMSKQADWSYWINMGIIMLLVLLGGLVAGLTIGIMSLDETKLHILKQAGNKHAESIAPLRKNGHLLLVTLLLANTIVNETLPILLHNVQLEGYQAILASTVLIVLFGEIIPQAVCARYGLAIGAFFAWPLRVLMALLWVISFPIAKLLDWVLGVQRGFTYQRAELRELVAYHGEDQAGTLSKDEVAIVQSILEVKDKSMSQIMTELKDVFMLSLDARLDKTTLNIIIQAGHSRIPVYYGVRANIIGVVLVKHLVLCDPVEATPLSSLNLRKLPRVKAQTSLFEMLHVFEQGGSHMALVVDTVPANSDSEHAPSVIGLVTLEDVIEELLGEEIIDETDVFTDIRTKVKVVRAFSKHLYETSGGGSPVPCSSVEHPEHALALDEGENAPLLLNADSSSPTDTPQIIVDTIEPLPKPSKLAVHGRSGTDPTPMSSSVASLLSVVTSPWPNNSDLSLPHIKATFGLGKRNKKI